MELTSTLIARTYAENREATAPGAFTGAGQAIGDAARGFAATLRESERLAMSSMTTGADPHAMVQALAQTELAVETVVTIRNKVVEAYQEILRMPI